MSDIRVAYDVRILAASGPRTGIPRYILELIRSLKVTPGWRGICIADRAWEIPSGLQHVQIEHVVWPKIPGWQQIMLPLAALCSKAFLIHSTAFTLPLVPLLPAVVTVHDLSFLHFPEIVPPDVARYLRYRVPRSLKQSTCVIVDSEAVRQEILEYFDLAPDRIVAVPLGVSGVFRERSPEAVEAFRRRKGLQRPYVLTLATLDPRKNLTRIVRSFSQAVKRENLPHQLLLIGPAGCAYSDVRYEIEREGVGASIRLLGYVSDADLSLYLSGADAMLYVSLYEGFGLPIIEAMACSCPVLGSRIPSVLEVAGDAALLVDPHEEEAIIAAILHLLLDESLRARLKRLGRKRAQLYDWGRTATTTMGVYQRALNLA